jgi:hypothetical protein
MGEIKMSEELTIKEIMKLLIANNLNRVDRTLFIGEGQWSVKAYRVGVKLIRIDVEDLEAK